MSGPKVDEVTLRAQERQRLEEARRRRMDAADKIITQLKRLKALDASADPTGKTSVIQQQQEVRLRELLEVVRHGNEWLDCGPIGQEADKLSQEWERIVRSVRQAEPAQQNNAQEQRQQRETAFRQIGSVRQGAVRIITEQKADGEIAQESVDAQVQSLVEQIKEFVSQPGIPVAKKNSILGLHGDLMELSRSDLELSKKSRRIARLQEDFQQIAALAQRELDEMRFVYDRYALECFDLPGGVQEFSAFRSKEEIEEAIRKGKEEAGKRLSREYIKRQIGEVMAKHGYDVVRSDILQQSQTDSQVLYGVNDQTAINVFVSEDDLVTMRVVGIGFDETMTPYEDENLFQQQCAFCSLHPQITQELKMRGVLLQTRKHLPPDRKYNKKIQTKTKNASQSTNRAKKELKRAEPKVMRKE